MTKFLYGRLDIGKDSFLFEELRILDSFFRHHKYGLIVFLMIYLSIFLICTIWIWFPLLIFSFTAFYIPLFLLLNYTKVLNAPIKFIWHIFFEYLANTENVEKELLTSMNIGYADLFDTKDGLKYVK